MCSVHMYIRAIERAMGNGKKEEQAVSSYILTGNRTHDKMDDAGGGTFRFSYGRRRGGDISCGGVCIYFLLKVKK